MATIPQEMYALQIDTTHDDPIEAIRSLYVVKKTIPKISQGQVLIRVEAAPCNPSDLLLLQGKYGTGKTFPTVPGWEGAGTVVAHKGGVLGWWLMGKRVAFSNQSDTNGTWGQYCAVDAKTCIVLKDNVTTEQGAALIINPLTAFGLVEEAIKGKHQAFIQTAAASQVGRMVLALTNEKKIPSVHIVRRKEQEDLLTSLGAKYVLNSESPTFIKELKGIAERFKATIAFDAIGGSMTGNLLACMPNHSKVIVYGALAGVNCSQISPLSLIFQQKEVSGFYLGSWIKLQGFLGLYHATNLVQKMLSTGALHTEVHTEVSLEDAPRALEAYQKLMTAGKVIIKPQQSKR